MVTSLRVWRPPAVRVVRERTAPSITLLRPGKQLIPLGEGGSSERVGSPGLQELDAQSANLFSAARDYCSMRAPLIRSVLDLMPSSSLSILDWILPPGVADGTRHGPLAET